MDTMNTSHQNPEHDMEVCLQTQRHHSCSRHHRLGSASAAASHANASYDSPRRCPRRQRWQCRKTEGRSSSQRPRAGGRDLECPGREQRAVGYGKEIEAPRKALCFHVTTTLREARTSQKRRKVNHTACKNPCNPYHHFGNIITLVCVRCLTRVSLLPYFNVLDTIQPAPLCTQPHSWRSQEIPPTTKDLWGGWRQTRIWVLARTWTMY